MPTIKRQYRKAMRVYSCDWCERRILIGQRHLYLYGYADLGDKPRALRYCEKCGSD